MDLNSFSGIAGLIVFGLVAGGLYHLLLWLVRSAFRWLGRH